MVFLQCWNRCMKWVTLSEKKASAIPAGFNETPEKFTCRSLP
jgi:hypothetical protein